MIELSSGRKFCSVPVYVVWIISTAIANEILLASHLNQT